MTENFNCEFKSQLEKFDTVAFVPKGNSMYPFIKNKAQTVYITKKKDKLQPFDIAMFLRENGTLVLHRIIEVNDEGYVFCGDSQFYLERVEEDRVIGVLKAFQQGKNTVEFNQTHRLKAKKWYDKKTWRKIRLSVYFFIVRVKAKLKRIFTKKKDR